jgi:hypothetical protein
LTVPDEIIEQIAIDLQYDIDPEEWERAEDYMIDNVTWFGHTRFDLSSFSKVCSSVRRPVERMLYRDIHLNFAGWNGSRDAFFPECRGGSLRLLLRTLESRIDLRGCVRSVQMDWYGDQMYSLGPEDFAPVADALRQFFSRCPSVQRLLMMTFPSRLEFPTLSHIVTVATSGPPDIFYTVVKKFPGLRDLYLTSIRMNTPPPASVCHHRLKRLHLQGIQVGTALLGLIPFAFWALEMCAHITEELRITCSAADVGYNRIDPLPLTPLTLSPSAATNLRSLRLDGHSLNFLAHPDSSLADAIRRLPSLHHLYMSKCLAFHTAAFSALPPSLRSLSLSEYGQWSDDRSTGHVFVVALGECLVQATRMIEMVATHNLTRERDESQVLGDFSPLQRVCDDRNIPFRLNISSDDNWCSPEIRILCMSLPSTI